MLHLSFALTASLYTITAIAFFGYALRGGEPWKRNSFYALTAAVVSHVVFVVAEITMQSASDAGSVWKALAFTSLLTSVATLLFFRRGRLDILGVFVTPVTLLLFLAATLGERHVVVADQMRSSLLRAHIGVNLLGIVLFSLASAAAVAYAVQEQLLRKKRLTGLFRRLPPLDELDVTSFRMVTFGFLLYSLGVVSGVFFMTSEGGGLAIQARHIAAFVAWALFASVVFLRLAIGWRGRRAALATILGFLCTVGTLIAYAVQGGMP